MSKVTLINEQGVTKEVKKGFSWTMLFFGAFVPLVRGDIKWCLITLIGAILTGGLLWFIFPFFYNKLYIQDLQNKGYIIKNDYYRNKN